MDTRQILADLRTERNRIDLAIAALETLSGVAAVPARTLPAKSHHGGSRHMSPAARRLISIRMKQRWAERKKKAGSGHHMSPAARKLISIRMKQRWAERKKKAGNGRHMSPAARKLISIRMKQRWAERKANS